MPNYIFNPLALDSFQLSQFEFYGTIADFPAVGLPNKLYLALNSGKIYRWANNSNSYIEVSIVPDSTDSIEEGAINKYYKQSRIQGTTNQINVSPSEVDSVVVLSLPQNIHNQAAPTFNSLSLAGTSGNGFLSLVSQSSAPATPASGFVLFPDSLGYPSWRSSDGFTRTLKTDITANREWILPDASGNILINEFMPNGTTINNVCYINQTTKPTTRPNDDALVIGDRWYNPATGVEGFWNGTYWLSIQQHQTLTPSLIGSNNFRLAPLPTNILLGTAFYGVFDKSGTHNSSNYQNCDIRFRDINSATIAVINISSDGITRFTSNIFTLEPPSIANKMYNASLNVTLSGVESLLSSQWTQGTPGAARPSLVINYHLIL